MPAHKITTGKILLYLNNQLPCNSKSSCKAIICIFYSPKIAPDFEGNLKNLELYDEIVPVISIAVIDFPMMVIANCFDDCQSQSVPHCFFGRPVETVE